MVGRDGVVEGFDFGGSGQGDTPDMTALRDLLERVKDGQVYYGTTELVTVTDNYNFVFENSTGSGVRAFILAVNTFNDVGVQQVGILANPDTNVPTTSVNPTNAKGDATGPESNFFGETNTSELSGGTATGDISSPLDDATASGQDGPGPDEYCGNCTHFDYVDTDDGMQPYCGLYEEEMDDMEACEWWERNS